MATIKGQNLRILIGEDTDHLRCIAASTNSVIHLALEVQEDTTKDTEDDWIIQEPVGINWDAQVDALVLIDAEDTGGVQANELVVGQVYTLRFSQTAGAAGEQNRDAITSNAQLTGTAILSDLQQNAQNQDVASYSAKFTGTGDLTPYYTPPHS
jgi:predicted secreted protein